MAAILHQNAHHTSASGGQGDKHLPVTLGMIGWPDKKSKVHNFARTPGREPLAVLAMGSIMATVGEDRGLTSCLKGGILCPHCCTGVLGFINTYQKLHIASDRHFCAQGELWFLSPITYTVRAL